MAARGERGRGYSRALKNHFLAKSGGYCQYCGIKMDLSRSTIDHVDASGPDTMENYAICCNTCNSSKGQKTLEAFRAYLGARELVLKEVLPDLKWSTNQLLWLAHQDWFPFECKRYEFYFERELLADPANAAENADGG
jgi:hypothetical protein